MSQLNHPIVEQSFAIIDREVGQHDLNPQEYALARRVIHATADFDYLNLLRFSSGAIATGLENLSHGIPIVTDVTMVKQGITSLVNKTFKNPIISAIEQTEIAQITPKDKIAGKTRTEIGMLQCYAQYPQAIYLIGNAPTALFALCQAIAHSRIKPALIIGVPVGFVSVIESKEALMNLDVPFITIEGHKGGSPAAASILNALLILAAETPANATSNESR